MAHKFAKQQDGEPGLRGSGDEKGVDAERDSPRSQPAPQTGKY